MFVMIYDLQVRGHLIAPLKSYLLQLQPLSLSTWLLFYFNNTDL